MEPDEKNMPEETELDRAEDEGMIQKEWVDEELEETMKEDQKQGGTPG